jgi:hypothetical protein
MATATEAPASTTAEGPTSHTLFQGRKPANTFGYTREQQIAALHKLREPFLESEIRYLPRVWCKACRDAKGTCNRQDHERRQCRRCGQTMTTAHIDLKFVGHAEATNRLLNVDPFWDWEPLTVDQSGLPMYDQNRGLWIRLTVCGMTRLGYGNAEGKGGGDAVKEIIGDAIRNAGMRFGMALDLWTTSDLEIIESGEGPGEQSASGKQESGQPAQEATPGLERPASAPRQPSEHLAKLLRQVTDCWNSNNVLIFNQIGEDGAQHGVLDEEFTDKRGAVTTLRKVLDGRIAEIQAAQGGAGEGQAA